MKGTNALGFLTKKMLKVKGRFDDVCFLEKNKEEISEES